MLEIKHGAFPESQKKLPGAYVSASFIKDGETCTFSVGCKGDHFCCGLYSLGGFAISGGFYKATEEDKIELVKSVFEKVAGAVKGSEREVTLMFTLIENNTCNVIRKALSDEKLFRPVKKYQNLNSGNNNTLYINV